jgi:hypothetical protein
MFFPCLIVMRLSSKAVRLSTTFVTVEIYLDFSPVRHYAWHDSGTPTHPIAQPSDMLYLQLDPHLHI